MSSEVAEQQVPAARAEPLVVVGTSSAVVEHPSGEAEAHYRAALELRARGQALGALATIKQAIAEGGSRDMHMMGASLAIDTNHLDLAKEWTELVLKSDPADADASYNLGLIGHRSNQYNVARTAYIATLRMRPDHAAARYNLAWLTWNHGVQNEARHHRAHFEKYHPKDGRNAALARLMNDSPMVRGQPSLPHS